MSIGRVILLDTDSAQPVFHAPGPWEGRVTLDDGWYRSQNRTVCGVIIYRNEWDPDTRHPVTLRNQIDRGVWLRLSHAEKFARPCTQCWK